MHKNAYAGMSYFILFIIYHEKRRDLKKMQKKLQNCLQRAGNKRAARTDLPACSAAHWKRTVVEKPRVAVSVILEVFCLLQWNYKKAQLSKRVALVITNPLLAKAGLYAMVQSFCLFVCLSAVASFFQCSLEIGRRGLLVSSPIHLLQPSNYNQVIK